MLICWYVLSMGSVPWDELYSVFQLSCHVKRPKEQTVVLNVQRSWSWRPEYRAKQIVIGISVLLEVVHAFLLWWPRKTLQHLYRTGKCISRTQGRLNDTPLTPYSHFRITSPRIISRLGLYPTKLALYFPPGAWNAVFYILEPCNQPDYTLCNFLITAWSAFYKFIFDIKYCLRTRLKL